MSHIAASANSMRDFIDIMTYRYPSLTPPQPEPPKKSQPKPEYTITFTKYPYNHTSISSKKYEYNVKDELAIYSSRPYDIDLFNEIWISEKIWNFSTKRIYALDQNEYKQIVIHYQTYTGVFNIDNGVQEKVMEVHMK
jgi:hypothetical protein